MATVKPKSHKDGITVYEIRVSLGRDLNNKQILKYTTWTPEPGMTPAKVKKELERQKVLFEDACRNGEVLDSKTKFAEAADRWLKENAEILSPAYLHRAKGVLNIVNQHMGHIAVGNLRINHLQDFYAKLAEPHVIEGAEQAKSINLWQVMADKGINRASLAKAACVAPSTVTLARNGNAIQARSADKIALALGVPTKEIFSIEPSKKRLSQSSIKYYHWIISSVLQAAIRWDALRINPAHKVKLPKSQKKEAPYLDDKQTSLVIDALAGAPIKWRTIVMMLIYSGARRGEICGLTWADIDFSRRIIQISKANQYLPGKGIFEKSTKNENSVRPVTLPAEMFTLLKEYRGWQAEERLKLGSKWFESGKVFTQDNGKPIHPDSITQWVAKFRETNKLPYFSPHTLRHTNATLLIMSNVPVKAVSARLGHANQNVTNAVYSHAIQTVDAMASDVVAELFPMPDAKQKKREI